MMASVLLKSLRFTKVLKGRLPASSVKYLYGRYTTRYSANTRNRKSYATAAHKLSPSEETGLKSSVKSKTLTNGATSIDSALSKVDFAIRRSGRTQLKNVYQIFSIITCKETNSDTHALYLLRSCKVCYDEPPSKRIDLVNKIWNKYQELGVKFDVRHYNALLDVHVANGLEFNPVEILNSMEELNIEPNKTTYMLIMKKYCQDGNISGASEILEYMKEKKLSADEKVFNYLIEGHVKNNDISGAKEMVEVMKSSNLQPTADTHAILACGYAMLGQKDEMMMHLKECEELDSIQNHLKVIDVLASAGNSQLVDEVLSLIKFNERHQQEFINAAVELIHKDFVDIAYKLAKASCGYQYYEGMNIFMKQLIKTDKPLAEVIKYCDRILKEDINKNIFNLALKVSVDYEKFDYVVPLCERLQKTGFYLRSGFFRSLFVSCKENNSPKGAWILLQKMSELGIPCDFTTYAEYVFPVMSQTDPSEILKEVKKTGQAPDTAADALFVHYCHIEDIDKADYLTRLYPVSVSSKFDVEGFVNLYSKISTESVPKYLKVLRYIFLEGSSVIERSDVSGRLLAEFVLMKPRVLENLLNKFDDIKFNEYTLSICEQEILQRQPNRQGVINRLRNLSTDRANLLKHENISIEDENKYLQQLQAQNVSCRFFLTKRLFHHIQTKNVTRVNELLSIHEKLGLEYTPLLLSNLMGLWCAATDLDKAKDAFDQLTTKYPDFNLELAKAFDYVILLMRYEKFDESYEALKNITKEPYTFTNKESVVRAVRKLNLALSDTRDVEYVKKMQSLLLPLSKPLGSKRALLDATVAFHLQKNDLKSAFEEFRNTIVAQRFPAYLNNFLRKCINSNEKDILQKVIDLTITSSGKTYALLELATAFIETYNSDKAAKVIDSLGQEADPKMVDDFCGKLSNQNKIDALEQLIYLTRELNHVDREKLYIHAFRACVNKNDFQRALQLVEKMKREVIEPEPETVKVIQELLDKNNQTLPLSLMSKSQSDISSVAAEFTKPFLDHLKAGNVEEALKELNTLKKGYIRTLPVKVLTDLVDLCLQKNYIQDLSRNVQGMSYIIDNAKDVLKPVLEKYSAAGDVEKFVSLVNCMPDFTLMGVGFNFFFCKAYLNSGKHEELLSHMEKQVDKKNKLFSPVAFEELLKLPEMEEKIFNLALKYLDSNYTLPVAVVWAHYFSKENYEKAEEIQKNFSFSIDKVDNILLRNIKQNENVSLAKKYVDFVKSANVRSRIKERAYGSAVDLLVFKGMYDEAADLVVESEQQNLLLHKYYLSTLFTLKNVLEKENKPVPFSIPLDASSDASSN